MKNYLAFISKSDFMEMYRFGYCFINPNLNISFNCDFSELKDTPNYFHKLTENVNYFERSYQNMIVHYEANRDIDQLQISMVKNILPLDKDAYDNYVQTLGTFGIKRISEPFWENQFNQKYQQFSKELCKIGAKNVLSMYGFSDADYKKIQTIIKDSTIDDWFEIPKPEVKSDYNFFVYLLAYDRHAAYPKNIIGIFMDVVHVWMNYKGHTSIESIEGRNVYSVLNDYCNSNSTPKFQEVFEVLKDTEFYKQITDVNLYSDFNILKIAALYLFLLDKYRDVFAIDDDVIEYSRKQGDTEFLVASYLLGLRLGNEKINDCLYNRQNIAILQDCSTDVSEKPKTKKRKSKRDNPVLEKNLFSEKENSNPQDPQVVSDTQQPSEASVNEENPIEQDNNSQNQ